MPPAGSELVVEFEDDVVEAGLELLEEVLLVEAEVLLLIPSAPSISRMIFCTLALAVPPIAPFKCGFNSSASVSCADTALLRKSAVESSEPSEPPSR